MQLEGACCEQRAGDKLSGQQRYATWRRRSSCRWQVQADPTHGHHSRRLSTRTATPAAFVFACTDHLRPVISPALGSVPPPRSPRVAGSPAPAGSFTPNHSFMAAPLIATSPRQPVLWPTLPPPNLITSTRLRFFPGVATQTQPSRCKRKSGGPWGHSDSDFLGTVPRVRRQ